MPRHVSIHPLGLLAALCLLSTACGGGGDGGNADTGADTGTIDATGGDATSTDGPSSDTRGPVPDTRPSRDIGPPPDRGDVDPGQAQTPQPGELVFSEIMRRPRAAPGADGQWVELVNVGAALLSLDDCTLQVERGADQPLPMGIEVEPALEVVFGGNGDEATNGGLSLTAALPGFALDADTDEVRLRCGTQLIDSVAWGISGDFPDEVGASMQLDIAQHTATANNVGGNWCPGALPYGDGDLGTPGQANESCSAACRGVRCDDPPTGGCDGTRTVTWLEGGACVDGLCEYIEGESVDCADEGQVCYAGACIDPGDAPRAPAVGELVITEIMTNPDLVGDDDGEWFELHNPTAELLEVGGCTLRSTNDPDQTIEAPSGLPIAAGGYLVLGRNADRRANGGVTVDHVYEQIQLGNASDRLAIDCGGATIDSVAWDNGDTFPDPTGASMQLDPAHLTAEANDTGAAWCAATEAFGDGELGTPGDANTACPQPCDGVVCTTPPPPRCEADTLITMSDTGVCALGSCEYAQQSARDCTADGLVCHAAACVDPANAVSSPTPGDLVITEIHKNSLAVGDAQGEWFELASVARLSLDLDGCRIESTSDSPQIIDAGGPLVVAPGGLLLFAREANANRNGGLAPDYVYSGLNLGNGADRLKIVCRGETVDDFAWDDIRFPDREGHAMQLDPGQIDADANDDSANWCEALLAFGDGDFGTPGAANHGCDLTACDVLTCDTPPPANCDVNEARTYGADGTCGAGTCSYPIATSTDCLADGFFCEDGACVDPCADVTCDTPPDTDCDGDTAQTYAAAGTCALGECSYAIETTTDCRADGRLCEAGACVDPCADISCTFPPPADCDGQVARTYEAEGTCAFGECTYAVAGTTECAGAGIECHGGRCVDVNDLKTPARGDVVINEVLFDPAARRDVDAEWVELLNVGGDRYDLEGCILFVGGADTGHIIDHDGPLILEPGGFLVIGASADEGANGGVAVDYVGLFRTLSNDGSSFRLACDGTDVDEVTYDAGGEFPRADGASMQLDPASATADANDAGAAWCESVQAFGAGDLGTPGAANDVCAGSCTGVVCNQRPADDCDGATRRHFAAAGTCVDGACSYPVESTEDCSANGGTCHLGACVDPANTAVAPAAGKVIFTEIMHNPDAVFDGRAEWFEVANVGDVPVDLQGCTFDSGSANTERPHTIDHGGPLILADGGLMVFAVNGDPAANGGVTVDYTYDGLQLGNNSDFLTLTCGDVQIDRVAWDAGATFPDTKGIAMNLDPAHFDVDENDLGGSWCGATTRYGDGDRGTPGGENRSCN